MRTASRDLDRLYWMLVVLGPLTASAMRVRTHWTRAHVDRVLDRLRATRCVLHVGEHWEAIVEARKLSRRERT